MAIHDSIDEAFEKLEGDNESEAEDVPHGDYFVAEEGDEAYETFTDMFGWGWPLSYVKPWKPMEDKTYILDSGEHTVEVYARSADEIEIYGLGDELTEYFDEEEVPLTMLSDAYTSADSERLTKE